MGHVGDGNFHVLMLLDADSEKEWQESETINHNLVRRAIAADGTCTGEHGVGLHKMQFMAEEHGDNALELMRSLKHAFDPNNILNPEDRFLVRVRPGRAEEWRRSDGRRFSPGRRGPAWVRAGVHLPSVTWANIRRLHARTPFHTGLRCRCG